MVEPAEDKDLVEIHAEKTSYAVAFGFVCGVIVATAFGIEMHHKIVAELLSRYSSICTTQY